MEFFRPQALQTLSHYREAIVAVVAGGLGLWIAGWGGPFFAVLGIAILGTAGFFGVLALRRMRFQATGAAPGIVQIDEGQISYMGPVMGGFVALPDLVELRLIRLQGQRLWRLKQADGQTMLVPLDATGAEHLFDAFSGLPGLTSADLVAALDERRETSGKPLALANNVENRLVWQRAGRGVVKSG